MPIDNESINYMFEVLEEKEPNVHRPMSHHFTHIEEGDIVLFKSTPDYIEYDREWFDGCVASLRRHMDLVAAGVAQLEPRDALFLTLLVELTTGEVG